MFQSALCVGWHHSKAAQLQQWWRSDVGVASGPGLAAEPILPLSQALVPTLDTAKSLTRRCRCGDGGALGRTKAAAAGSKPGSDGALLTWPRTDGESAPLLPSVSPPAVASHAVSNVCLVTDPQTTLWCPYLRLMLPLPSSRASHAC